MIKKSIIIPIAAVLISTGVVSYAQSSNEPAQEETTTEQVIQQEPQKNDIEQETNKPKEEKSEPEYRKYTSYGGNEITTSEKVDKKDEPTKESTSSPNTEQEIKEEINPRIITSVENVPGKTLHTCVYYMHDGGNRGDRRTVTQPKDLPCLKVGNLLPQWI